MNKIILITLLFCGSAFADDIVYKSYPGTTVKDYSNPQYVVEGNNLYPVYDKTTVRDFTKDPIIIDRTEDHNEARFTGDWNGVTRKKTRSY